MDQRFAQKNVQQSMVKTSGMPSWKEQSIIKQKAKEGNPAAIKAKNLSGKQSLSAQEVRRLAEAKKELGILKNVGTEQMVNRIKRQVAEEAKAAAKERAGKTAAVWRSEEARKREAEAAGKFKAATSISKTQKVATSALGGQKNAARGEGAFVSAARAQQKTQAPAEKKEEKPQVIDILAGT